MIIYKLGEIVNYEFIARYVIGIKTIGSAMKEIVAI